jgi:hypothetical protein
VVVFPPEPVDPLPVLLLHAPIAPAPTRKVSATKLVFFMRKPLSVVPYLTRGGGRPPIVVRAPPMGEGASSPRGGRDGRRAWRARLRGR